MMAVFTQMNKVVTVALMVMMKGAATNMKADVTRASMAKTKAMGKRALRTVPEATPTERKRPTRRLRLRDWRCLSKRREALALIRGGRPRHRESVW